VTHGGQRKVFEKSIGSIRTDKESIDRRKRFHTELLELKKQYYLTYLEANETRFNHLPSGYAYFLALARNQYQQGLSKMYPRDLDKYRKEQYVRYVHHTTAIEGNTLSLQEAAMILDKGKTPGTKDLREVHEVENYRHLMRYVTTHRKDIDQKFVLKVHYFIQRNIDDDSAGSYRRIPVGIVGSNWEPPHPIEIQPLIEELFGWYQENKENMHPLELAGAFHHKFLQIHPFIDGNGRVGRELMNYILKKNGFPPIVIPADKRLEYYKAMEEADKGDLGHLLELLALIMMDDYLLAVGGIVDDFRVLMGEINEEERMDLMELLHWNLRLSIDFLRDTPPRLVETIRRSGLTNSMLHHS
jgi:fido (protein-threonine AMPylation protein)